ncbi:MAG: hypothetical protein P8020_17190 [Acidobacteriota bacterium]
MRYQAAEPKRHWILSLAPVFMLLFALGFMNSPSFGSDYYPARISKIDGTAAYEPAGEVDWEELTINLPLLSGDRIFSHVGSRVEVDFGQANFLRLGAETDVAFSNVSEKETALVLHSGSLIVRINRGHLFQISTPDGVVTVKKDGLYRIDTSDAQPTEVVVRKGKAEIDSRVGHAEIGSGQQMVLAAGPSGKLEVTYGYYEDALDNWSDRLDASYVDSASVAFVGNSYYPGVWDLDYYGTWDYYPGYGQVWIPRVSAGWVPFRYGRWMYASPWGYTWVSYDPWGWLPYHYGSWLYWGSRWCWRPGGFGVWAAAPVNFYFGGGFVGWAPRGYYGGFGGHTIINNNTVIVNNGHVAGPGRRGFTAVRERDFRYGRSVNRLAENVHNDGNVRWRSGLPTGMSTSFREGRQAVARSDRFGVAAAQSGTGRVSGRRVQTANRDGVRTAAQSNRSRQTMTSQRAVRSVGGAGSAATPSASRDRSRTSVTQGRTASGDVRTYSVGQRTASPARQSQERSVQRAPVQNRSGSATRTAPAQPVAPSSRVVPPVTRSRTVSPRDSFRSSIPQTGERAVRERPSTSSNLSRIPSSYRSAPQVSRPSISRQSVPRSAVSRPSISRSSVPSRSFSRPSAPSRSYSRPSVSRPSVSRPSRSSAPSRPSSSGGGGGHSRPNRH